MHLNVEMSLLDLPNELLYHIISNVESEIDLYSLLQAYSDLEALILPDLHQLTAEKYDYLHLEYCAAHGMAECMRYSLNIHKGFGSTFPCRVGNALRCAAMIGRNDMVQMLLDNGADINDTASSGLSYGLSALNYAIQGDQPETVRLLAVHGADLNLRMNSWSNEVQFPLWLAVMGRSHKMAGLLLELGAETDAWFHYFCIRPDHCHDHLRYLPLIFRDSLKEIESEIRRAKASLDHAYWSMWSADPLRLSAHACLQRMHVFS